MMLYTKPVNGSDDTAGQLSTELTRTSRTVVTRRGQNKRKITTNEFNQHGVHVHLFEVHEQLDWQGTVDNVALDGKYRLCIHTLTLETHDSLDK